MGALDFPCPVQNRTVDAEHDRLHAEPPDIPTRVAVQRVGEVLQHGEPVAYGYDRDDYLDILMDLSAKQQGDLLYALLDARNRTGILIALGDTMRERVRKIANDEVMA